jgi:hypothetical protein
MLWRDLDSVLVTVEAEPEPAADHPTYDIEIHVISALWWSFDVVVPDGDTQPPRPEILEVEVRLSNRLARYLTVKCEAIVAHTGVERSDPDAPVIKAVEVRI